MIPTSIVSKLNRHEEAISFGSVTLKVVKHDGHKTRYLWTVETAEVEDSPTSGGGLHEKHGKITKNDENFADFRADVRKGMRK